MPSTNKSLRVTTSLHLDDGLPLLIRDMSDVSADSSPASSGKELPECKKTKFDLDDDLDFESDDKLGDLRVDNSFSPAPVLFLATRKMYSQRTASNDSAVSAFLQIKGLRETARTASTDTSVSVTSAYRSFYPNGECSYLELEERSITRFGSRCSGY